MPWRGPIARAASEQETGSSIFVNRGEICGIGVSLGVSLYPNPDHHLAANTHSLTGEQVLASERFQQRTEMAERVQRDAVAAIRRPAKSAFYVYENWQAGPHRTMLHRAECPHCNEGKGTSGGAYDREHGAWHGPFQTSEEAATFAKSLAGVVDHGECGHCMK